MRGLVASPHHCDLLVVWRGSPSAHEVTWYPVMPTVPASGRRYTSGGSSSGSWKIHLRSTAAISSVSLARQLNRANAKSLEREALQEVIDVNTLIVRYANRGNWWWVLVHTVAALSLVAAMS